MVMVFWVLDHPVNRTVMVRVRWDAAENLDECKSQVILSHISR